MQSLRYLSVTLALGLVFSGCSKNDSGNSPSSFTIEGLSDLSLKQAGAVNVPVTVKPVAGTSETVSLVATGVPENVQIGVTPASGEPSFSTTMTVVAAVDAKAGTYPVKLVGTSKSGVVVEKGFNLTVRNQNCAQDFQSGTWNGTRSCQALGGGGFQSTIAPDQYLKQISISNFGNFGSSVTMTCNLDCDNGTLTVPSKTFTPNPSYSYALSGDGSFTQNELRIRIFYEDNGRVKDTCTVVYTR